MSNINGCEVYVLCNNCIYKGVTTIPKGKLIVESSCPLCANKTLKLDRTFNHHMLEILEK